MLKQSMCRDRLVPAAGIIFNENGLGSQAVSPEARKRGDFEELAMPLFDSLYNFARWLTQNREEAEDLVQETYVKALKGFSSFQPGTNFRAWMFRILRNSFLNSRTGLAMRMTVGIEPEEEEAIMGADRHTPESILLQRISHEAVAEAIEQLPVHYREVLLLCDVEELKYHEIAETLCLPVGTVMSRLSRARKAVRESLEKPSGVTPTILRSRAVLESRGEMTGEPEREQMPQKLS
ncbi:MAG TPA: sigma-70 family RNA polymerase sigma factor [Terriglobales bacterium]|jgi:RNA polymerase sigma-70 factor (ECF subfamily)|nr:sigma-70 family RNA polymerase sigma factor [Terriglobales bacterium]